MASGQQSEHHHQIRRFHHELCPHVDWLIYLDRLSHLGVGDLPEQQVVIVVEGVTNAK